MNKREREKENMLAEAFHGDWATGPTGNFAQRAALTARRRHSYFRMLGAAGAAAGIAAAVLLSFRHPTAVPQETAGPSETSPVYEIISDDELLSQLKDRPLLVLRDKNGKREFLLLTTPELAPDEEPDDS